MKFRKVAKWMGYIVLFLLVVIYILGNFVISFSTPNDKTIAAFAEAGVPLEIKTDNIDGRSFQYLETGADPSGEKPLVLLVHGAPGGANMYDGFLQDPDLLERATLVSPDRLGYGHSGLGDSEPSLEKQGDQLHQLLKQYPGRKVIAVGHSYGGPIIVRQAIDYPDDLAALLLLAPALDPKNEKYTGLAKVAWWKLTRWYFPKLVRVSADEKLAHVAELEKMQPLLGSIKTPVLHVHGDKDSIVPYVNLAFARENFPAQFFSEETLPGSDHFLIEGEDYAKVKKLLLELIASVSE